ncbi:transketolase family protein [Alkalispirochaeta alkalica]|uniref:transketolase family protein n=1 Tax=Alkalispirochaeta alkalica TaxID=46356 RepID=UPI00035C66AB|nr:transketolase C-terminal domain-containing protein [Alkalispirochaeta alkalica]
MEILSKVHAKNLVAWADKHPEVVVLSADLTGSTEIDLFRDRYPERFFSFGVAEQNMISFAGGLAREGYVPFIHTFSVFIYRQALSQIVNSVAYSNLPVKFFGFLPGITTPGGATHQAIEDLAVMRAIPNMTVLEPGDATEVETILDSVIDDPGPVYVRMLRGEIPRLFSADDPFVLGKPRVLSEGDDVTIVTSGICTEEAMRVTSVLKERGLSVEHLHVSTHKPFDGQELLPSLEKARYGIITMENHSIIGGLGSEISEVVAESGVSAKVSRLGLKDTFAHGGGRSYLSRFYEIDALALVGAVEKVIGKTLEITEADLQGARIEAVHSLAKEEAL